MFAMAFVGNIEAHGRQASRRGTACLRYQAFLQSGYQCLNKSDFRSSEWRHANGWVILFCNCDTSLHRVAGDTNCDDFYCCGYMALGDRIVRSKGRDGYCLIDGIKSMYSLGVDQRDASGFGTEICAPCIASGGHQILVLQGFCDL